jgi:hypothetical protein
MTAQQHERRVSGVLLCFECVLGVDER